MIKKDDKLALRIYLRADGTILIDSLKPSREFTVNLLCDALKVVASQPDIVQLNIPKNQSFAETLKNFIARKK